MTPLSLRCSAVAAAVFASSAFAQTPPPAPTPIATDVPVANAPLQDPGHLRWGLMGEVGSFVPFPTVSLGTEVQLGYQLNRTLGVYGVLGASAGIGIGASVAPNGGAASVSINVISYAYLGAMVEAMFADSFFVGGGLGLAHGAFAGVTAGASTSGATTTAVAASGFMPTANVRVGLGFGAPNSHGIRDQFTIALDGRLLLAPSAKLTVSGNANGSANAAASIGLAAGFAPMLMLGYTMR